MAHPNDKRQKKETNMYYEKYDEKTGVTVNEKRIRRIDGMMDEK